MDSNKVITHWLAGAEKDWLACQHLYQAKDYPQCLFWGHLVIQKLLKALIVKTTEQQAPYSHDLLLLAMRAQLLLSREQRDLLNEITTFNQFGRYDNEIVNFLTKCTPEYTEKYFLALKKFYLWLLEHFPKNS